MLFISYFVWVLRSLYMCVQKCQSWCTFEELKLLHTQTGWVLHCPAQLPSLQQHGQKRSGLLAAAMLIISFPVEFLHLKVFVHT